MSWLRVDDGFVENPKIIELSDRAFRLHMAGLCFCARNLTDGLLTDRAVRGVCALTSATRKHIAELVQAGVWLEHGGRFEIKDFLDYNPAAETAKRLRAERSAAGRRGAEKRWADGKSHGNGYSNGHGKPHMPRPVPILSLASNGPLDAADRLDRILESEKGLREWLRGEGLVLAADPRCFREELGAKFGITGDLAEECRASIEASA